MQYLEPLRQQVREEMQRIDIIERLLSGEISPQTYQRYLENVWHYAQHSSIVIGLAGSRAVATHPQQADYLLHHAREELGHEKWALDDLAALGADLDKAKASRPVPACAAMVGLEYYIAGHANPIGLFGWLYILEAMGDDLGHIVSKAIENGLNLPDGVKFLAGHGEADVAHTRDIISHIEQIKGDDLAEVHYVAKLMSDLYPRIFMEISEGK